MVSLWVVNFLFGISLIIGLAMTLMGLPGNIVILVTAVGYGFYDAFIHIHYQLMIMLLLLFIAGEAIEFIAGAWGAKKEQAARRTMFAAVIGAIAGGVLGTGVLPLIGSIAGAMLGAYGASYASEYLLHGCGDKAKKVAVSVMKGQIAGMIFKLGIAVVMVITIVWYMVW